MNKILFNNTLINEMEQNNYFGDENETIELSQQQANKEAWINEMNTRGFQKDNQYDVDHFDHHAQCSLEMAHTIVFNNNS